MSYVKRFWMKGLEMEKIPRRCALLGRGCSVATDGLTRIPPPDVVGVGGAAPFGRRSGSMCSLRFFLCWWDREQFDKVANRDAVLCGMTHRAFWVNFIPISPSIAESANISGLFEIIQNPLDGPLRNPYNLRDFPGRQMITCASSHT